MGTVPAAASSSQGKLLIEQNIPHSINLITAHISIFFAILGTITLPASISSAIPLWVKRVFKIISTMIFFLIFFPDFSLHVPEFSASLACSFEIMFHMVFIIVLAG